MGLADVIIGTAAAVADCNGVLNKSHIKDKLVEMTFLAETMHCCSLACSSEGFKTPQEVTMLIRYLLMRQS